MKPSSRPESGHFNLRVVFAFALCSIGLLVAIIGFASGFGLTDIDLITGTETSPHVTQSTSSIWAHADTIVVAYTDTSGATLTPLSVCSVSTSTDGGASFTRLPYKFNTGGECYTEPSVFYSTHAAKWYMNNLSNRCGGIGIAQWTSPDGINWSNGNCAAFDSTSGGLDTATSWVDNNSASPFYGRQYVAFNNYNFGGYVQMTSSTDDGVTWHAPITVFTLSQTGIHRAVKITGSPGSDGTVFIQTLDEGGGSLTGVHQNFIHRSTDGGNTWSSAISQGATFMGPGTANCSDNTYFTCMYPSPTYWRDLGWGQAGVGPNGVVHYAYGGRTSTDAGNIYYVRSTDNGSTWSSPIQLNTDTTTRAQWGASLSVNAAGQVFVSWYDQRNTTDDSLQRFGRASFDNGLTWSADMAVSDVVFPKPLQPDSIMFPSYAGWWNHAAFNEDGNGSIAYHSWTDGRVSIGGSSQQDVFFDKIPLNCTSTAFFTENFDGVTAPALPSGWVATNAQGPAPLWVTSNTSPDTSPNDAFVDDPGLVSDKRLDTPSISIPSGANAQLVFRHSYNLESDSQGYYDGGVLEISSPNINAGAFTDITDAAVGGSFLTGGYVGTIATPYGSPIGGRMAWSGNSGGYITTVANLGSNVAGQTIKLRFRMASDNGFSATGWRIDTISISRLICAPVPLSVFSQKVHGSAGTFRIPLPLTGNLGIECRRNTGNDTTGPNVGHDHELVVTFPGNVTVGSAEIVNVTTSLLVGSATFSVNNNVVTVDLHGLPRDQNNNPLPVRLRVNLKNVSDGTNSGLVSIPMGYLLGDVNGSQRTDSGDVTRVRNHTVLIPTDDATAVFDVNLSGRIDSGDVTAVRNNAVTTLP